MLKAIVNRQKKIVEIMETWALHNKSQRVEECAAPMGQSKQ